MTAAEQDCATCDGTVAYCRKATVTVNADGTLEANYADCDKAKRVRYEASVKRLIRSAGVPAIFANIRADTFLKDNRGNRNPQALTAADAAIFDDASLYIYGGCGVGKTMLAAIIANERAREHKSSLFVNVPDVLEDLRDYNDNGTDTRQARLAKLYTAECLIVDDLGAEKASDWTCETLFKIVNRRYNDATQTIFTSNFSIEELARRLNFTAGDRIVRRICDMCKPIHIV